MQDRQYITVDELRTAGALDVPEAWKKSLGEDKNLFSDMADDDAEQTEKPARTRHTVKVHKNGKAI